MKFEDFLRKLKTFDGGREYWVVNNPEELESWIEGEKAVVIAELLDTFLPFVDLIEKWLDTHYPEDVFVGDVDDKEVKFVVGLRNLFRELRSE